MRQDRAARNEYTRNWTRKRIAQGICPECGSKIDRKGSLCRKCADRKSELGKKNDLLRGTEYHKNRLEIFQKLSRKEVPECKYCGCDVYKALELNHKNGGGSKDKRKHASFTIINQIANGTRDINDYEVACRVCNAEQYSEKKWGLQWEVKFIKQSVPN